jgi:transcriptional regulator with XRE-family HTH domain
VQLTILKKRREELGITISSLARMSKVPVASVNRILSKPASVRFDRVAAVARVLGVDFVNAKIKPVERVLRDRAIEKAQYIAKVVQGTQGLEASGVDSDGYKRIVSVAAEALLSGKKRKLWDED